LEELKLDLSMAPCSEKLSLDFWPEEDPSLLKLPFVEESFSS